MKFRCMEKYQMNLIQSFPRKVVRSLRCYWDRGQLAVYRQLSRFFPITEKSIVFINFNGKGYGDNPKYIANEIIRKNLSYRMIWLIKGNIDNRTFPKEIKTARINSIKGVWALATSKIIVNNVKNPLPFIKKQKQYYIQTWHGPFGLKYIENDAREHLNPYYIKNSFKDSKMTDLFISSSNLQTEEFRSAFWYDGEIMECGMPRNDFYFHITKSDVAEIKHAVGVEEGKKILLYCPTFRDDMSTDAYNVGWEAVLEALNGRGEGEWVILIRLHPNVLHAEKLFHFTNKVINVSTYSDMQQLTAISDLQITDYSSTLYDSIILKTPIILYAPDIEYYQKLRGLKPFYFELPFKLTRTNEQLIEAIKNFDYKDFTKELESFSRMYQYYDNGHASECVVEKICNVMEDVSGSK